MELQESHTFHVAVHLETKAGELPTEAHVCRLVLEQMGGVLDEDTGLRCTDVRPTYGLGGDTWAAPTT